MINPQLARRLKKELDSEDSVRAVLKGTTVSATICELAERLVIHRDNVTALLDQVRHEAGITPQHIEELVHGP